MTDPVIPFTSKVVPMLAQNIDTDQIIPARYVSVREPEEFAFALFRNLRNAQPDHVLDRVDMQGRTVILAGRNFGCGSSREAAVWALVHGGFRAVIAPSFGDIFYANALKNALLPIRVTDQVQARLVAAIDADPDVEMTIDLPAGRLSTSDHAVAAEIQLDRFYRELLVHGIDELDYLITLIPEGKDYERGGRAHPSTRSRLAADR